MTAARITPFPFRDFAEAPITPSLPITEADLEAARAKGVEEGRALERAAREAFLASSLARIADALAAQEGALDAHLAAETSALRAAAHAFLSRFAAGLSAARESEIAVSLIDRLLAASRDRAACTLELSAASFAELRGRVVEAIAMRGASGFIEVAPNADLAPGECRLVWRGGVMERRLAAAEAALAACFGADQNPEDLP